METLTINSKWQSIQQPNFLFQVPVLVLGHLLKIAHEEKFVKGWRDQLPAKSSNHITRQSFEEKRRFGQFALDVYDASVGGEYN